MKAFRFTLSVALLLLSPGAFTRSEAHTMDAPKTTQPKSEAEISFEAIKTLAGEWEGPVAVAEMPEAMGGKSSHVSMRVTSRGNSLVHELQEAGTPLDATKYDHPVTMLYVDGGQLNLVHYCDAGNRPHMVGKLSPDGKKVEFEFADISGSMQHGHMHHAVFTLVDANHHIEDWTFIVGADKPMHAHFDLHRTN